MGGVYPSLRRKTFGFNTSNNGRHLRFLGKQNDIHKASALYALYHVFLTVSPGVSYYCPNFVNEDIDAHRGCQLLSVLWQSSILGQKKIRKT